VLRAVRALGIEPRTWDLLGHSFGGFVALELNKLHPGELTRLIASCTMGTEEPLPEGVPDELDRLSDKQRTAIMAVWERESRRRRPTSSSRRGSTRSTPGRRAKARNGSGSGSRA
jgi:pimeloyl-ACP methyl ester carboxylesterase